MSLDKTIFRILKAIDVAYENNNFNLEETLNLEKLGISERRLILMLEQLKEKKLYNRYFNSKFNNWLYTYQYQ